MTSYALHLSIDDTCLRLLVTQGRRARQWASIPLEPGTVHDGVIRDPELFGRRLIKLSDSMMVTEGLRTRRLRLSISGRNVVTKRLEINRTPATPLDEDVARGCVEALPVPLDELQLVWHPLRRSKASLEIFCAGIYRSALNANLLALKQLKVVPGLVEPKIVALTRAIGQTTALVLDVESTSLELLVVRDGIPDLVRVTQLTGGEGWQDEVSEVALAELSRIAGFYSMPQQENPLAQDTPLFVTGAASADQELQRQLEQSLSYPLTPLPARLRASSHFPATEYAVNTGMSLGGTPYPWSRRSSQERRLHMNLLPDQYKPDRRAQKRVLAGVALAAALALLFPLYQLNQDSSDRLGERQAELDNVERLLRLRLGHIRTGEEIQLSIDETQQALDLLAEQTRIIRSSGGEFADVAEALHQREFPGMALSQIVDNGDTASVRGVAENFHQVLAFVDSLKQTPQFSRVKLAAMNSTSSGSESLIQFTISIRR